MILVGYVDEEKETMSRRTINNIFKTWQNKPMCFENSRKGCSLVRMPNEAWTRMLRSVTPTRRDAVTGLF